MPLDAIRMANDSQSMTRKNLAGDWAYSSAASGATGSSACIVLCCRGHHGNANHSPAHYNLEWVRPSLNQGCP